MPSALVPPRLQEAPVALVHTPSKGLRSPEVHDAVAVAVQQAALSGDRAAGQPPRRQAATRTRAGTEHVRVAACGASSEMSSVEEQATSEGLYSSSASHTRRDT